MEAFRVQSLAKAGNLPPQYIQPPDTRPHRKHPRQTNDKQIPTVDLCGFDPALNVVSTIDAIGRACREWGVFHVVDHGVPAQLLRQIISVGHSFFNDSSVEEKLVYACDPNSAASEGYGSRMLLGSQKDTVLDWRDYFDHHTLPLSRRNPSRWPHFPPNYRQVVADYADNMKVVAHKLLALISESLGLPSSCIEEVVGEFYQNITISFYPPCPQPDLTLGLQAHSDMGAITLLIQDDVSGLEVFKDGEWVIVNPLPDAILVILADQTEVISNGIYKSAVHRAVTNDNRARLSVATFHDPAKAVKVSPASQLVTQSSLARYRPVVYGDYVSSWYSKGPEGRRNLDALLLDRKSVV